VSDRRRCPNCDDPVPDGARVCLSCYADLRDGDVADDSPWAVAPASGGDTGTADGAAGGSADGRAPADAPSSAAGAAGETSGGPTDASVDGPTDGPVDGPTDGPVDGPTADESERAGWESRPATLAVAAVAGIVVGVVALVSLGLGLAHWSALPLAVVAWLATTVHLARRGRTRRGVAHACYAVAFALATLPLFWFGPAPQGGSLGGRVLLAVVSFVAVGLVAGPLAGVGYWVGKR
jgi:hypothetical protein